MANKQKKKVFVALSGGVDSSVALALLKNEGYDVYGVFMKNWSGDNYGLQADCPWEQDQSDAEAVCKVLNVPFRSFNFEKEYREKVVEYFFDEYKKGRTPNPDVMCNKEIKFGIFLDKAMQMGADLIATGHYAQVKKTKGEFELYKGVDSSKDQSYFLCELTQYQLSKTLFPIGHLKKTEVRDLAKKFKLPVSEKKDSQGICFIGHINVASFLRSNIKKHEGEFIDIDTKECVGKHDGFEFYTIGQREGLKIGGSNLPYYVVSKDKIKNIVYVAKGKDNKHLYKRTIKFSDFHKVSDFKTNNLNGMIRYRQKTEPGVLNLDKNIFVFHNKQRAVTCGQLLALYDDNKLVASAVIED